MTDDELNRLQALADAATAGPWTAAATVDEYGQRLHTVDVLPLTTFGEIELNDAAFIAASRDAMPALIAEVRRLRAENAELRDEVTENDELRPMVSDSLSELVGELQGRLDGLNAEVRRLRELLSQARQVLLPADSCAACAFRLRERMLGDSGPLCCKACNTFILLRSLLEVTP